MRRIPTKICINLHFIFTKKVLIGHQTWSFSYALVLMLLTKFIPNFTIRNCSSSINLFKYDAKFMKYIMQNCTKYHVHLFQIAPKKHFLHHYRKLVQIRYSKSACTKMFSCVRKIQIKLDHVNIFTSH